MNQLPRLTSVCRSCHYFAPEGRRGGTCQKLGVPVQGSWKSCSLAISAFSSSWDSWDNVKKLDIWETATALPKVVGVANNHTVNHVVNHAANHATNHATNNKEVSEVYGLEVLSA